MANGTLRSYISLTSTLEHIYIQNTPALKHRYDRGKISLLTYASMFNQIDIVRNVLGRIDRIGDRYTRTKYLKSPIPKPGIISLGLATGMTALHLAMISADSDIVVLLLNHGVNPLEREATGTDAFMFACVFGRLDNVKRWCEIFPDWDISRTVAVNGMFFSPLSPSIPSFVCFSQFLLLFSYTYLNVHTHILALHTRT